MKANISRTLILISFLWLAAGQINAATRTVTKTADTNDGACNADCSLREAIAAAAAGDTIVFSPLFNSLQTIMLSGGELLINKSLNITGTRALLVRINGGNTSRVFNINGGAGTIVSLSNLEITNGNAGSGFGGGVFLNSGNTLNLTEVMVLSNRAARGGGICAQTSSTLNITRTAIISNLAIAASDSIGGGILNSGTANISNSTITINQSTNVGSGIFSFSSLTLNNVTVSHNSGSLAAVFSNGQAFLRNTIIAANISNNGDHQTDLGGTFVSLSNNLIGSNFNFGGTFFPAGSPNANGDFVGSNPPLDPLLDGISSNGGQIATRKLLAGSVAINHGNNCVVTPSCPSNNPSSALTTDQRGDTFLRQLEGTVDIGAYETGTIRVSSATDNGIRQAIANVPAGGAINFAISPSSPDCVQGVCTIFLTQGDLFINKSLTIVGTGARSLIIRPSTSTNSRIFRILDNGGVVVNISRLTIANGNSGNDLGGGIQIVSGVLNLDSVWIKNNTSAGSGGGIANFGTLNITNSTVNNNAAANSGGGVWNSGTANIVNSTISDNTAGNLGGGILNGNHFNAALTLNNVTVSNNTASDKAGGVFNIVDNGVKLRNTVIAGNTAVNDPIQSDIYFHPFISSGNNLIGKRGINNSFPAGNPNANGDIVGANDSPIDPQLGALQNNGGQTDTRALLANSPALNRGNNCVTNLSCASNNPLIALSTDQRGAGFSRLFSNFVDIGAFEAQVNLRRAPFDFDGDNRTDISIFRPSAGEWWYLKSSNGGNAALQFGISSDKLAPGDFTGDGKTDIAFFRPASGFWFILRSEDNSFFSFPFGTSGDLPCPADFDGDSKTDACVFRPAGSTWYILRSSDGGTTIGQFGANGDIPVTADYDGDGKSDVAIFRPSDGSWWYLRSIDNQFRVFRFGVSTDKPVQGDYTGDGKADIAVFRPSTGEWFILRSEDNSFFSFPFGQTGDLPAPGDYDGDGIFDAGVFRPSTANWFVQRTTAGILITTFGTNGDRPVPNAFIMP